MFKVSGLLRLGLLRSGMLRSGLLRSGLLRTGKLRSAQRYNGKVSPCPALLKVHIAPLGGGAEQD